MKHLFKHIYIIGVIFAIIATTAACSVKYAFNGASIDYTKTKTIELAEFPIRSSYVWGPMGPMFNNQLKDEFASHTRLIQVIAGEAKWRPQDRGRNHTVQPAKQVGIE